MKYQKDLRMAKERKRRSSYQLKRLKTLRAKKSPEEISEDARKAGLASGGHFTKESSQKANEVRWAKYRAAKAAALKKKEK